MIWIKKGYVVERKQRIDGLYEFVVTRGNRVIGTIVPKAPKEESYIRNQLKKVRIFMTSFQGKYLNH